MRLAAAIMLATLLMAASPGPSPLARQNSPNDWQWLSRTERADFYLDQHFRDTVEIEGNKLPVVLVRSMPRPEEEGGPALANGPLAFHWKMALDCRREMIGILDYVTTRLDGAVHERKSVKVPEMKRLGGAPIGETEMRLFRKVCSQ